VRDLGNGGDIDQLQQRIGWRFHPHHFGLGFDRGFECGQVTQIDKTERKPGAALAHLVEQPVAATIEIVHHDRMSTAVQKFQQRGRGRETRCEREYSNP